MKLEVNENVMLSVGIVYTLIWILLCVGDPDIIDAIIHLVSDGELFNKATE